MRSDDAVSWLLKSSGLCRAIQYCEVRSVWVGLLLCLEH
jgi:hypothetical protein